jgi:hypothetical protein
MPSWIPSEARSATVLDRAAVNVVPSVLNAESSTVQLDETREMPVHGPSQDPRGDSTPSSASPPYIPPVRRQSHNPNLTPSLPTQARKNLTDGVGTSGGSSRRVYRPTTRTPIIWAPPCDGLQHDLFEYPGVADALSSDIPVYTRPRNIPRQQKDFSSRSLSDLIKAYSTENVKFTVTLTKSLC